MILTEALKIKLIAWMDQQGGPCYMELDGIAKSRRGAELGTMIDMVEAECKEQTFGRWRREFLDLASKRAAHA